MVRLYNARAAESAIGDAVSVSDVCDRMDLYMAGRYVEGAISAAAEHLAWVLEDRGAFEGIDVEEELEGWRFDYSPSWTIYTSEINDAICDAGIYDVIECYVDMFGDVPTRSDQMIGAVLWDLTGAVIAAFEDVDWDDVDVSEAWEGADD